MNHHKFSAVAHRDHDYCNPISAAKIERLLELLPLDETSRVLDLGCGRAELALRIIEKFGSTVVAVDHSSYMLDAARERAKAEGLDIEYQVGDAEKLPFADGQFDAVISTCGIMFATRPELAAAEIARVTRKGGRATLTTWLPDSNLFKMFMVMKPYMPAPPTPAPPSPFEWGKQERVQELLGSSFDLRFEKGTSFYREPNGEAAWNTLSTGYGPTKALAGSLDEARRAELRRDFIAFHDGFPTELGICVPREYLLTFGTRR